MPDYRITCARCGLPLTHTCTAALGPALTRLLTWAPDRLATARLHQTLLEEGRSEGWLGADEDPAGKPFFGSQAWIYALLGKEDARTFQALLNCVMEAAGIDAQVLRDQVARALRDEQQRREEQEERLARFRAREQAEAVAEHKGRDADEGVT